MTNNTVSVDFEKQSKRVKIEDMTFNVNEARFEYIEKNPMILSNYYSPKQFTITAKGKRVCKLNHSLNDVIDKS